MKPNMVRTSIEIPRELHAKLRELAARKGCSARAIILGGIESAVGAEEKKPRRLSLDPPIVPRTGPPINFTNEELYELIDFP